MAIDKKDKIQDYIDCVCSYIKNKEIHEEIKLELECHIEEVAEGYLAQGLSLNEALDKAVSQMGDPKAIGKQLNKVHRRNPEWSIVVLSLLFAVVGLMSIYFIDTKVTQNPSDSSIFARSLTFTLLGIALAVLFYFLDYRKIRRFSKYIYCGTLLLLFLAVNNNGRPFTIVNSMPFMAIGPLSINLASISPYLFILSLAGLFDGWEWDSWKKAVLGLAMLFVPVILMLSYPSFSSALIYSAAFIVLMVVSGVKLRYGIMLMVSEIGMFILVLITGPAYRLQRFLIYFNIEKDPLGAGYINTQLSKILGSAGIWGQGFNFNSSQLPGFHTDFILAYIIYTFGWIAGLILTALFITFILRITGLAKNLKNSYGRLIVSGFGTLFALQFLWNVLMTLGLVPVTGIGLPFISYGDSQLILNMTAVGIISSIYRRKNEAISIV